MTAPGPVPSSRRAEIYPLGFLALGLMDTLFAQWTVYFHVSAQEVAPAAARWAGTALLVGYMLQGVANPFVGAYTDRARHRWGRRRPFVLFGAPVLAMTFTSLWWGHGPLSLLAIPLHCLLFALVAQPYASMLPSIAPAGATRVRITMTGSLLALIAAGAGLVGGPHLIAKASFPALGFVGAAAALLCLWPTALVLREALPPTAASAPPPSLRATLNEARELLALPEARRFLPANACFLFAIVSLTTVAPFVPEVILGREPAYTSVLNGWLFAGMLVSVPVVARMSRRMTPASMMAAGGATGAVAVGGLVLAGGSEAPTEVWWLGFTLLGFSTLLSLAGPPLELSRIAEIDGKHREGLLFGLNGLIALGVGRAISAQSTVAILSTTATTGHRAAGVLLCLGLSAASLAMAAFLLRSTDR